MNFFFLTFGIPFDFSSDVSYKQCGFSKTLLNKDLKFVLNKEGGTVFLNLSPVLLQVEVDLIPKE